MDDLSGWVRQRRNHHHVRYSKVSVTGWSRTNDKPRVHKISLVDDDGQYVGEIELTTSMVEQILARIKEVR
jgi:hypothetical protein